MMNRIWLFVVFIFLFCCCNGRAYGQKKWLADSVDIKSLKYIKLNQYVDYYVLNPGKPSGEKNIKFTWDYMGKHTFSPEDYLINRMPEPMGLSASDLNAMILSSKFNNIKQFRIIFRVSSDIVFGRDTVLLKSVLVIPNTANYPDIKALETKLRGYEDVASVRETKPGDVINGMRVTGYILGVVFRHKKTIDDLEKACKEIDTWPGIKGATDPALLMKKNHYETFLVVTSN
jgi:hypothetical protein